jgi:AraC family transcriptional activator of pobA
MLNLHYSYSARPVSSFDPKTEGHTKNAFDIRALKIKGDKEEGEEKHAPKESCRIIWIKEGSGAFYVDMRKYSISSNAIYCIKPGQAVKFEPVDGTHGYTISFSTDFLVIFHPLSLFSIIKVENRLNTEMLEIVEKMIKESSNAYPGKEEILRGLLRVLLVYLNRQQEQSPQQPINPDQSGLATRFFSLLEKNFANRKMVSDYARNLSVTPNYLNEIVKKTSGFPASYHIQQRIILEAKRKAAYVRTSMKEIAYGLGFDDISHFSKYFKKASGVSFTDFKKEISQQFSFAGDL